MRWCQLLVATVVVLAVLFASRQVEAGSKKKKQMLALILLSKIPKKKVLLPLPLPLPLPIPIIEKTKKVVKQEPVVIKKVVKVPVKEPYPVPVPYKEPVYVPYKKDPYPKDDYPAGDSYSSASDGPHIGGQGDADGDGYYGPGEYDPYAASASASSRSSSRRVRPSSRHHRRLRDQDDDDDERSVMSESQIQQKFIRQEFGLPAEDNVEQPRPYRNDDDEYDEDSNGDVSYAA